MQGYIGSVKGCTRLHRAMYVTEKDARLVGMSYESHTEIIVARVVSVRRYGAFKAFVKAV